MSFIQGVPPGWLTQPNLDQIAKIAFDMKRTDYQVLEIGSFLGRSTMQWFAPWKFAINNGKTDVLPPRVMCIDTFEYKMIGLAGRQQIEKDGYKIDWRGNMLNDFKGNMKEYLPYMDIVKANYPLSYRISLEKKFDIVFIDTDLIKKNLLTLLKTLRLYVIPYRTVVCGPHYDSAYAEGVVEAVNEYVGTLPNSARFQSSTEGNIWSVRV